MLTWPGTSTAGVWTGPLGRPAPTGVPVPSWPGEQGQQLCAGMELALEGSTDYPRLLAWGAVMGLEGTPLVQQRELLHLLGLIVPFKWRVPGSMAGTKPVGISSDLEALYLHSPHFPAPVLYHPGQD